MLSGDTSNLALQLPSSLASSFCPPRGLPSLVLWIWAIRGKIDLPKGETAAAIAETLVGGSIGR